MQHGLVVRDLDSYSGGLFLQALVIALGCCRRMEVVEPLPSVTLEALMSALIIILFNGLVIFLWKFLPLLLESLFGGGSNHVRCS